MSVSQPIPPQVLAAFQEVSPTHRATLLVARELIFQTARDDQRIGAIEETLRWGEPAYITATKRTGSTIRLGIEKASEQPALFFNCNTTLVEDFRQQFGDALTYCKNRAVVLDRAGSEIETALKMCIKMALTYHLRP